ncbi:hypothetical protein [Marinomonas transparens]|uniref:Uncharacterized protein n=1 Tax=Marinomonas transparens TaxID=2795388 RepID=A0A934JRW7_9GAMM|nr:hypothetical protein [Marinomonas transparens]MBJ7536194.1 hypothetical protein [Marinomonas transparens]
MLRGNPDFLEAASEREYDFYIDYLTHHVKGVSIRNLRGSSKSDRVEKLNIEIDSLVNKNRAVKNLTSQMRAAFKATQLISNDFKWLDKKDERLCNWAWCYLKRKTEETETPPSPTATKEALLAKLSVQAFASERDNVLDRCNDIIDAFHHGEASLEQQLEAIEFIKSKWKEVRLDNSVINWLDDSNTAQWAWAWSYLQNITQRPLKQAWLPVTTEDQKAAVITTFDLADNQDRKALVIDKMKKAWSQKKFREKTSGKKPYSISMTLNTKQKLNALAAEKGLKINEMIEFLIRNEYKKRVEEKE